MRRVGEGKREEGKVRKGRGRKEGEGRKWRGGERLA